VKYVNGSLYAVPLSNMGRLEAMAAANALIEIPEGCAAIRENSWAEAWFFNKRSMPSDEDTIPLPTKAKYRQNIEI